jgi:hypothetical protein
MLEFGWYLRQVGAGSEGVISLAAGFAAGTTLHIREDTEVILYLVEVGLVYRANVGEVLVE